MLVSQEKIKVAVAMSGGVDSSVAASLMVEQGYSVIGVMLRLWSQACEDGNRCCTPDAVAQARRVAGRLKIPFYVLDAQALFYREVVQYFLEEHRRGRTPNPCMMCNSRVRWGFLLQQAQALGAEFLVTGHYARVQIGSDGKYRLMQAVDLQKDQSYVLSGLGQAQLAHTLWPLGDWHKTDVREKARELGLEVADKPDSQDLCFVDENSQGVFLRQQLPDVTRPGPIVDEQGRVLGEHEGLAFYTIGQRKGLRVAAARPLYVLEKDIEQGILRVGFAEALGRTEFWAGPMEWVAGEPPAETFDAQVKIRYKAKAVAARVMVTEDGWARVILQAPVRDCTPGQFAVFYDGINVLGRGQIAWEKEV